jgi:hypothetical protein
MFRSYDHHQAEKYVATLGLLNWQRIRCFIISYIIVIAYILLCIVLIRYIIIIFQPDDGRTTETCSYVYISNIS